MIGKNLNIRLATVCLSFLQALAAPAVTILYVDANAPTPGDGRSWLTAYKYLQDALADANAAPKPIEIRVAQGTYRPDEDALHPNGTSDREASFQLVNGVTLKGGYAGPTQADPNARDTALRETVLTGDLNGDDYTALNSAGWPVLFGTEDNTYRIVTTVGVDTTAVLDGLTITAAFGSGMYNADSSPVVMGCSFVRNQGAVYDHSSSSRITHCIFLENLGTVLRPSGTLMEYCVFERNYGTAIWTFGTPVRNCTFTANYSHPIFISSHSTIENCTFTGNIGGAVYACDCDIVIRNCTFVQNLSRYGSAIYNDEGDTLVTNCILWDNECQDGTTESAQLAGYRPPVVSYSCIKGWSGALGGIGNFDADPCFAAPGYWDSPPDYNAEYPFLHIKWVEGGYHLKSQAGRWDPAAQSWVIDDVTSTCIDAGDPMSPIGLEPFPNGGRINMGAYGGTPEASKSYFNAPPCETIVAGDINGDCKVDLADFALLSLHWLDDPQ